MEYQQLLIAFCFYSLFVQQSQFAYAGKHLCPRDQAFYLLQFKQGLTVDPNAYDCENKARSKTLSWNVTGDCCEWDGVTCNGLTGHVIGLDLSCSFLIGTINANNSLTKLGHLQRLNLASNEFNDFPLGNSISELSSLTHLNLSDSGIFNERKMIPPGLCKLSKLISLDLSGSYIQVGRTTFTSLLQNLTNLEVLLFDYVYASFELPKKFPSSLRKLSLQGTNVFGNITDSQLFHLPNLQVLRLGDNPSLTGTLPNFHWNFSKSVLELDFSYTGIFGKVPDSIGILQSLWRLNLFNCHLSGSIPESFGNLTTIRELILSGNNFTGNILSTISKLNKLVNLHLSSNHFRGSIPESIGNLTAIRELILSDNSFTGNVPSSIGKLNKLDSLSLSSNNFEGSIPDTFANFSELYSLDFHSNNFVGPFPYSIATLTHLDGLELQNNSLTGPLPSNISGFQNLFNLDLSFNHLTGATPPWLFQLPSLMSLSVQANKCTGELPNELNRSTSVPFIDISYNNLHGEIPYWMLSMVMNSLDLSHNFLTGFEKQVWHSEYLSYLNLENNFLQGPLHQSICDLINLEFLILAQNNFNGSIPDCLGNSNRLISILDLRMNNFHGEIPTFLPRGLEYLGLYGNQLRGQVPRSLVNRTSLVALDLGNNKLNDTFPIWLEKLPNLQVLILKSNLFHGPIGDLESEFPFPELRIFDLSFNGFTGTLSSNLFKSFRGMMDADEGKSGISRARNRTRRDYLYHVSLVIKGNEFDMRITSIMTSVDLSSNRFEGDIPNSIGNLSSLVLLNLSHNSFRGHIPAEFTKLQQLEALDLSWNRLIGEIPGQLSSLTFLEVLNLSYNHLAGRIPIGKQFNTFPNDSYCGNPDLCGFPLSKECGNKNESPLEHDDDDDDSYFMSGFTWEAVAIGYGCGMIVGLLIGGLMFLLEKPKWYVNFAEDIAQQIAAKKRTRQKKRRQRHGVRMS
ncbi:receptor-like protein 9DC3 [Solanum pennellii]|uniref:Receptor-like protein 9DC3 n=1 Tax=Solanum pennellii TaxID=28526 RepID=A0ABM1HFC6_SOLPN|nr:receptor-like protein 9DC3 [Solanum pennellii]